MESQLCGMYVFIGGKAKPLKQPKVDKKEYDEVCFDFVTLWIYAARLFSF